MSLLRSFVRSVSLGHNKQPCGDLMQVNNTQCWVGSDGLGYDQVISLTQLKKGQTGMIKRFVMQYVPGCMGRGLRSTRGPIQSPSSYSSSRLQDFYSSPSSIHPPTHYRLLLGCRQSTAREANETSTAASRLLICWLFPFVLLFHWNLLTSEFILRVCGRSKVPTILFQYIDRI